MFISKASRDKVEDVESSTTRGNRVTCDCLEYELARRLLLRNLVRVRESTGKEGRAPKNLQPSHNAAIRTPQLSLSPA